MAITNGYATLVEFKALKDITSTDAADDGYIESMIERASRIIDAVCGRHFYAYTETRYYSLPSGRMLPIDDADLLTVTTLTNGDGTVLTTDDYYLKPKNGPVYYGIVLKESSNYIWERDSNSNSEGVISVAGTWGYCSRSATDPYSARVISNTTSAVLDIALMKYHQRFGQNTGGQTIITAAGVVQTPAGAIPQSAYDAIKGYIRRV